MRRNHVGKQQILDTLDETIAYIWCGIKLMWIDEQGDTRNMHFRNTNISVVS